MMPNIYWEEMLQDEAGRVVLARLVTEWPLFYIRIAIQAFLFMRVGSEIFHGWNLIVLCKETQPVGQLQILGSVTVSQCQTLGGDNNE